jgi:hypothetical protein
MNYLHWLAGFGFAVMRDPMTDALGGATAVTSRPLSVGAIGEPALIIAVDDDPSFLGSIVRLLRANGLEVRAFSSTEPCGNIAISPTPPVCSSTFTSARRPASIFTGNSNEKGHRCRSSS